MKQTSLGNMDGRKKSLERPKNNSLPWRIRLNVSSHWDCFYKRNHARFRFPRSPSIQNVNDPAIKRKSGKLYFLPSSLYQIRPDEETIASRVYATLIISRNNYLTKRINENVPLDNLWRKKRLQNFTGKLQYILEALLITRWRQRKNIPVEGGNDRVNLRDYSCKPLSRQW